LSLRKPRIKALTTNAPDLEPQQGAADEHGRKDFHSLDHEVAFRIRSYRAFVTIASPSPLRSTCPAVPQRPEQYGVRQRLLQVLLHHASHGPRAMTINKPELLDHLID
jgi:hypothetical protein